MVAWATWLSGVPVMPNRLWIWLVTLSGSSSSTGYEIENGLETTDIDTTTYWALANHSPLEYMNSARSWVHYPYERHWVDYPRSGTSTGNYCLTGDSVGYDVWKAAHGS